ncbi:MAG: TonB-dependent siderophore receptor [Cyanobacteria bacterium P01_D01_bin.115]
MMIKLAYGTAWTIGVGAIAALAMEPALAETLMPLPEGDPAMIDSTSATALLTEPETASVLSDAEVSPIAVVVPLAELPSAEVAAVTDSSVDPTPLTAAEAEPENTPVSPDPIAQTQPVAITDIQIEETAEGFSLRLEASGELATPATSVTGNAAIADIPNAVLQLPDSEEFFVSEPAEGISLINVTNLPDNQVRIAITGTDAPPAINLSVAPTGLTISGVPGDPTVQTPDEEAIQVVVTGEDDNDDYFVPDTTTATRTETPILDTPASIQVIPQELIEDQQATDLQDVLRNLSGITPSGSNANSTTEFTIRGFQNAPILRDGFRQNPLNRGIPQLADLEQVEVLRGPASILYGAVEPGGVINLVSKQPLEDEFYEARLQIGNRSLIRPQVDLSGPLTEDGTVLYRLNLAYESSEPFQDFDQGNEQFLIAPVIAWRPSDRTDITFRLQYSENEAPTNNGLVAFGDGVVDVPFDTITTSPDDPGIEETSFTLGYDFEHRFSDNWRLRNALQFSDFSNDLALRNPFFIDEDTGILGRVPVRQQAETQTYSLQTNVVGEFATGSIDHTLLFGIDLDRTEDAQPAQAGSFGDPLPLNIFDPDYDADPDVDFKNLPFLSNFGFSKTTINRLGIYVQDQINLLDNLILVAGLRYDTVEQITAPLLDFNETGPETTRNDDAITPRLGIVYQPTPEISLYGSYSQSFTPNTGTTAAGDALDPELGEGFEVGAKAELLDGNLFATLAYFNITRRNIATADPNNLFGSVATGEQRSQGIELDLVGEILPGWNIIANYAYIDAEVTEDNTIPVGNRLFNVPEHSASLWTTYEIQQGDLQGLGFGLGLRYVGEREGDLANSFQVDDYLLTNAAVFYRRDNWRFALNVENLFDVDYIETTDNLRRAGIEPGDPFTIIGSISVQF